MRILIVLAVLFSNNPTEIAKINEFKKDAEKAFNGGDFNLAIEKYRFLVDSLEIGEDEVYLNLAHAYYQANDTANARTYYSQASMSPTKNLKSIAYQQLGVMAKSPQTLKQSLQYLKAALKADPSNDGARYDYELVKKLIEEQEKQQQDQENQDQENQENEDQENQDQENQEKQENQEGEENEEKSEEQQEQEQQDQEQQEQEQQEQEQQEGEENPEQQEEENQEMSAKEKLEEMNIPEDKARMILEAMKNAEIQYLQQQKRKATERPKSGKPDW